MFLHAKAATAFRTS